MQQEQFEGQNDEEEEDEEEEIDDRLESQGDESNNEII